MSNFDHILDKMSSRGLVPPTTEESRREILRGSTFIDIRVDFCAGAGAGFLAANCGFFVDSHAISPAASSI